MRKLANEDTTKNRIAWINIVLSVIAIIVSIMALFITGDTSKRLLEYQIDQERLPRVLAFNQEIAFEFQTKKYDDVVDFSSFVDKDYIIEIPIYNIGVGTAQNCVLEWELASVNDAYSQMINSLEEKNALLINKFTYFGDSPSISAFHAYNFEEEDGKLNSLKYLVDGESGFVTAQLYTESAKVPYMVPVVNSETNTHIGLPEALSIVLIECANQKIDEPMKINLHIKYEDLSGKDYEDVLQLTFSLKKRVEFEDKINCVYDISVEEILYR